MEQFSTTARNKLFDPELESPLELHRFGPFWTGTYLVKQGHYLYQFPFEGKPHDLYLPPIGVWLCAHCSVQDVTVTTRLYAFSLQTPSGTMLLAAGSEETKTQWMSLIYAASLEYRRRLAEVYQKNLAQAEHETQARLAALYPDDDKTPSERKPD